jgi:protoporphyrinogen oxidase
MKPLDASGMRSFDVLVIGAGVSGLSAAQRCKSLGLNVAVLEQDKKAGGLIRCERINGSLHHLVGGHVFNTKLPTIRKFFWGNICKRSEFAAMDRNAKILLGDRMVNYPIENHIYELSEADMSSVIDDLVRSVSNQGDKPETFQDFLYQRFGKTLCELYFIPYNRKIWQKDLADIAVEWLGDKLPMPTVSEILRANINRKQAHAKMVHDSFFYPKTNGSQQIVESLMKDVYVVTNERVDSIIVDNENNLTINGKYRARHLVYTGDARRLPSAIGAASFSSNILEDLQSLEGHGTTNVLFACKPSNTSWTYIPLPSTKAHRIINTGLFATTNTARSLLDMNLSTSVVEFSGYLSKEEAYREASLMPGFHAAISYNYRETTYVIQSIRTRHVIKCLKEQLESMNISLVGRFAEWEYYNMDTAMHAAIRTADKIGRRLSA